MYAKLFSRITESSLMEETIEARYVFVMFLAIADPRGEVIGTDVALARRLNMSLDQLKLALAPLMEPDPDSNSRECEGRRIVRSNGERGYHIVNYLTYRNHRDEAQRREYMANYIASYRADGKDKSRPVNSGKLGKLGKPRLAQAEAEAEAEAEAKIESRSRDFSPSLEEVKLQAVKAGLPDSEAGRFFNFYESNGWRVGRNPMKSWTHALSNWKLRSNGQGHKPTTPPPDHSKGF